MFTDAEIHAALVAVRSTVPGPSTDHYGICGRLHDVLVPVPRRYSRTAFVKRDWLREKVKPVFRAWLTQRGVIDHTPEREIWPVEDPEAYFRQGNKWVSTHPAYSRRMDLLDFMINYYAP